MSHLPTARERTLNTEQQAIYDIISFRLREIDAGFNTLASEMFIHEDAGLMGRELRRRLRRDLRSPVRDVKVLARGF